MITRKSLIEKLQKMNLDQVLFPGYRRPRHTTGDYHGYAAENALRELIGVDIFNQMTYLTVRGISKANPKWFRQLYTDLAWDTGDITPGSILQALT